MFNISFVVHIRSQYMTKVWPAANKLNGNGGSYNTKQNFACFEPQALSFNSIETKNRVSAHQKTTVRYVHKDQNKRDENDS